jgi:hypothetical protein
MLSKDFMRRDCEVSAGVLCPAETLSKDFMRRDCEVSAGVL